MTAIDSRAHVAAAPGMFSRVSATLNNWYNTRVTRRELSRLSDRELDDIGLVRGDIDRIARGL
ncbi:DUF1127 domain-containing protein [Paracoccus sp. S-4012]|uniref:DUF1127 domain-containing protein n=1 Tax=Paracoccus sp. S-4012 TaxID=2665648 RepID=UPI0012B13740|nr:DUF1127 domain-containing protein [Paracoccus sp. S-4012]MRX49095.1 DUF1127 domain-containing protein [Paracoccus sp. S-4012]